MNYLLLFVSLIVCCRAYTCKEERDVTVTSGYSFECNNEANGNRFSVTNLHIIGNSSLYKSDTSKVAWVLAAPTYVSENVKVTQCVSIEYSNQLAIPSNSQIFIKQCDNGKTQTFSYDFGLKNTMNITGTSNLDRPIFVNWKGNYVHIYKNTDYANFSPYYEGEGCVDLISLNSGNNMNLRYWPGQHIEPSDFPFLNMILLSNKRLIRYCPNEKNNEVHCYMTGNEYKENYDYSSKSIDSYPFTYPHCPCDGDESTNCFIHVSSSSAIINKDINSKIFIEDGCSYFNSNNGFNEIAVKHNNNITIDVKKLNKLIYPNIQIQLLDVDSNEKKQIVLQHIIQSSLKSESRDSVSLITSIYANYIIEITKEMDISHTCISSNGKYIYVHSEYNVNYNIDNVRGPLIIISDNVTFTGERSGCSSYDSSNSVCLTCKNSYYLSEGKCLAYASINNCKTVHGPICTECDDGYYLNDDQTSCLSCGGNCSKCNDSENCLLCKDGYLFKEEKCILEPNCNKPAVGICAECNNGNNTEDYCNTCSIDKCLVCAEDECLQCEPNHIFKNGECIEPEHDKDISIRDILSCESTYYLHDTCSSCSIYSNCTLCDQDKCTSCKEGYYNNNGICLSLNRTNGECNNGLYEDNNGRCIESITEHCNKTVNGICVLCNDNYYYNKDKNECMTEPSNCLTFNSEQGCIRCLDRFYLDSGECKECDSSCKTCFGEATYCTSCEPNEYINEYNDCESSKQLAGTCLQLIPNGQGCAICQDGYYRDGLLCSNCSSECLTCNNGNNCLKCNDQHFMTFDGKCKPKTDIVGCSVEVDSVNGCTKCNNGYYLYQKECYSCPSNCIQCSSVDYCTSCIEDNILYTTSNNQYCGHYENTKYCKSSSDNKCDKCSFWHEPDNSGTKCNSHVVWWVIVIAVLVIIIIFIIIIVFITRIIKYIIESKREKEMQKKVCIFNMKRSNVKFSMSVNKVLWNKEVLTFDIDKKDDDDKEIPVNKESRDLLCIGNKNRYPVKIQITTKDSKERYEIRTEPQVVTLKKNQACEFSVFIKPLCTCDINDKIYIITLDEKKNKEKMNDVGILFKTIINKIRSR